MNLNSIQFKLIVWYSGLIILVSLAFGAALYRDIETRLLHNTETTLVRRAHQLGADILPRFSSNETTALAQQINEVYSPDATDRFIRITSSTGTLIYSSGTPDGHLFDPVQVPPAFGRTAPRVEQLDNHVGMLIVGAGARLRDQAVWIEMGGLTNETDTVLHDLRNSLLLGLPIVALIVSAGGYVLVRRSLRIVEQLRSKAQEITFGNLDNRLPVVRSGDSIEQLAVTLNQMLERLSEAYHQANRFSADASHELRTPLAIMRAELESLAGQPGPMSAELRKRLGSVLEEAERLSSITESLFALSRLQAGEAKAREVRIDLADLAQTTVDQMRLLSDDKGISLRVETLAPVFVEGDPARLKQIVVDLLDNAIKYTAKDGSIVLRVGTEGRAAHLQVIDTGMGIPADDLPHVFERFYRADKARSRNIDGAGLGLAIVHSICQAHGGSVRIESTEGHGTTCHVHIPLAA